MGEGLLAWCGLRHLHSYLHQLPSLIDVLVSAIDEERHLGTAT